MIGEGGPFVLLDDARAGIARLYRHPLETVAAHCAADLPPLLDAIAAAPARGLHAAGWLSYEAGALLGGVTPRHLPARLGWFGLFEEVTLPDPAAVHAMLGDPGAAWAGRLVPDTPRAAYDSAFAAVQGLIAAGDIYQANLTLRTSLAVAGPPPALYAALRARSAAAHGALLFDGADWLLSLSPELFVAVESRKVTARPMKGTAARRADPADDAAAAAALVADPKQRAENLMIVDLLRNDLSRVAVPGSVAVPDLFTLESYPTVHTMTSTVTARLREGEDVAGLLRAAFPCGSITGAPKRRAMEVIDALEDSARGPYCGSIGWVAPDGNAAFNVAIRTLWLPRAAPRASLGLGSGVVADSICAAEWAECMAKGEFATVERRFDLFETLRFEPAEGFIRLESHLERMKTSAQALEMVFDRHAARNALHAASFHLDAPARVRMLLSAGGALAIECSAMPAADPLWRVALMPLPVDPRDVRLQHKCTDRAFYDDARIASGADEVIFVGPDGALTEGSRSNVFVAGEREGGPMLTPALDHGLLPGVLRASLIADGRAVAAGLTPDDLARGFWCGNSLRGLVRGELVTAAA